MEVTSQPAAFAPRDFHTGLMSCCEDTIKTYISIETCMSSTTNEYAYFVFSLQGSMCTDFFVGYFCMPCAACQMKRDIDISKRTGQF
uniref:Uncharacterized protein n=1 Tax=Cyprinus carpio TaxID=7962 RepID=A0A8C2BVQ3_CYPCA